MKLNDVLMTMLDGTYFEVTKNNGPTICMVLDRHKIRGGKTSKIIVGTITERDLNRNNISINDTVVTYYYHANGIYCIELGDANGTNY